MTDGYANGSTCFPVVGRDDALTKIYCVNDDPQTLFFREFFDNVACETPMAQANVSLEGFVVNLNIQKAIVVEKFSNA